MIGETIAYYRILARPGKPGMGGVPAAACATSRVQYEPPENRAWFAAAPHGGHGPFRSRPLGAK